MILTESKYAGAAEPAVPNPAVIATFVLTLLFVGVVLGAACVPVVSCVARHVRVELR